MGVGHLSPTGTRGRFQEIVDYRGKHTDLDPDVPSRDYRWKENRIRDYFVENYGFREPSGGCELIRNCRGVDEKVLAATGHGVELRTMYHPSGLTQYFYLVVVSGEFHEENLAVQHLEQYYRDLKKQMKRRYGVVKRKTSAWTSTEIEVEV